MLICPECGYTTASPYKFCPKTDCGERLKEEKQHLFDEKANAEDAARERNKWR